MSRERRRGRKRPGGIIALRVVAVVLVVAICIVAAVVVLAVGGSGGPDSWNASQLEASPIATYAYPVQMFPNEAPPPGQGRHVADTVDVQYGTDPPTSGPHYDMLVQSGIFDTPIPKGNLVHNMEHGWVIIWYNCQAGPTPLSDADCQAMRAQLSQVVQPAVSSGTEVIMVPYPPMTHHIALTAWQFLDVFDEFDKQRVLTFISTFVCHYDPEDTCK